MSGSSASHVAMDPPRKLTRRNLFSRVDEFRQEQRERKIQETVEQSRRVPRPEGDESAKPDPRDFTLDQWLDMHGTRTGAFTFNGVTYTDMNEVDWRIANKVWKGD